MTPQYIVDRGHGLCYTSSAVGKFNKGVVMSKVVHFAKSTVHDPACGCYGYNPDTTVDVNLVTCKTCLNTWVYKEFANVTSKIKYHVIFKDKLLFTGDISQIEEWLSLEALKSPEEYTLIRVDNNQYKVNWKFVIEKI